MSSKVLKAHNKKIARTTEKRTINEVDRLNFKDTSRLSDLLFGSNRNPMFEHQYGSYDWFLNEAVRLYLTDGIHIIHEAVEGDYKYTHKYLFENIKIESPKFENGVEHFYPCDARYYSQTYSATILCDVVQVVEKSRLLLNSEVETKIVGKTPNHTIAHVPLMLRSGYCNLTLHPREDKSECEYDPGCYFIVNGSEKVIISQDRMKDNTPLVFAKKESGSSTYVVQVNSRSYSPQTQLQIISIKIRKDGVMVTNIPLFTKELNIMVIFRALGTETDYDIINSITNGDNDIYMANEIEFSLNACVDDKKKKIVTTEEACDYLLSIMKPIKKYADIDAKLSLEQRRLHLQEILRSNFLPHIRNSLKKKSIYLGYMLRKLLLVKLDKAKIDNRDSYENKRIDHPGDLLFELFKQQFKKMMGDCSRLFIQHAPKQESPNDITRQIKSNIIDQGLKNALLTGSWIRRSGVAQMYPGLTFLQRMSFLRRVDAPGGDASTSKLTNIRQLGPSDNGGNDPSQTPEHAKVGLTKHLCLVGSITVMSYDTYALLIEDIEGNNNIIDPHDINLLEIKNMYRVFLNGEIMGFIPGITESSQSLNDIPAVKFVDDFEQKLMTGYYDQKTVSIVFDHDSFEIRIFCDSGRLFRPVLRVSSDGDLNIKKKHIESISLNKSETDKISEWNTFVSKYPDIIRYIDMELQPHLLIAPKIDDVYSMLDQRKNNEKFKLPSGKNEHNVINRYESLSFFTKYACSEIHPSLLLGEITATVPFANAEPGSRLMFQYAQSKQAMGIPNTYYPDRLDITHILGHTQKPLVTTMASKYLGTDKLPQGENVVIAINCYTGFNQEDSIIGNQTAFDRGLFSSYSYKKYGSSISKSHNSVQDDVFGKMDPAKVVGGNQNNYSKVSEQGYAVPETMVENGDIIIAKFKYLKHDQQGFSEKEFTDDSEVYKSHCPGVIDAVYSGIKSADGSQTIRISLRSMRTPKIGDKFCSKFGQKGTIGFTCPNYDMPFSVESMMTPDLIINPHAFPSRMTISKLLDLLLGKHCALTCTDGDGTPFEDYDMVSIEEGLVLLGFNKYGLETMYNGMTGVQFKSKIFMAPTFYQRLKHMVDDKIHSRARGPKNLMTHQATEGRTRDGGLRVGEMERDTLIAHGIMRFCKEKFMDNSDAYSAYVCGTCGFFAQRTQRPYNKKYPQESDSYFCAQCNNYTDIHKILIPYAFKLMIQELRAMCIAPRIRVNKPYIEV